MKALTWQGVKRVSVEQVPDPTILESTDAIIRLTSTAICGSDLHLYDVLGPFLSQGDILGHEAMGIVEAVGSDVNNISTGDRVVVPFNISCGHCFMCERGLYAQCETTQVREYSSGAALFGYTKLYGAVPGAQAEYLRVPQAHFGPIKVPEGQPDERFLFLSDVLPTAWQAVEYADIPPNGTVAIFGLGPIGQMSARIAHYRGAHVIATDNVPERLAMARRHHIEVLDESVVEDVPAALRDVTGGRGPDSVIDAVGMEAHGWPAAQVAQKLTGLLPDSISAPLMQHVGVDRMAALIDAFESVRRGGTVSIIGVYGGMTDPFPMLKLFDKGVQIRMGQAHVRRWTDQILPLLLDDSDPLGVDDLATHRLPLDEAPRAYEMFQKKQDGAIKIVLKP